MSLNNKQNNKVIILLSGGLDSALCLAELSLPNSNYHILKTLTFDYGQKAFQKELKAAQALSTHYGVEHQLIALPWYQQLLPEAMDNKKQLNWQSTPEQDARFFDVEPVWIPNRNGVLLNIAAAFAEAAQCQFIAFGANAEEGESFPDNTLEFQVQVTQALAYSTLNQVKVLCPVGHLTKTQMILRAQDIKLPLDLIWSCYSNNDTPCGHCPSCYRVERAMAITGPSRSS